MKHYLLIAFILLFSGSSFSTEQIPEEFIVDEAKFEIYILPLEQYPHYKKLLNKLPSAHCSASWRNYKGRWELRNNYLWLDYLFTDPCSKEPKYVELSHLFNGQSMPIKATWFTGSIKIRISARKYFSEEKDGFSAMEYQAVIYRFESGKLVTRSIDTITEQW